jgi:hypothetical protein
VLLLRYELGYVQIHARGAELLFQIMTEREERASIGLASNLPFSESGTVFPDPRLVTAIVDRVTFNAHILETGFDYYRLRTPKITARQDHCTPQKGGVSPLRISPIAVTGRRSTAPGAARSR